MLFSGKFVPVCKGMRKSGTACVRAEEPFRAERA